MKVFTIVLIIIIFATIINAVRLGDDFPILQSLPFLGGIKPIKYEIAGIIFLCITAWACHRVRKRRNKSRYKRYPQRSDSSSPRNYDLRNPYFRNYRY